MPLAWKRALLNGSVGVPQGSIPDMTATTELYLRVQKLYRDRAEQDVAAVAAHVGRLLQGLQRDPNSISGASIRNFVKNARNLRCEPCA